MIHIMDGDWQLFNVPTQIDCKSVYEWIKLKNIDPISINIDDIGHKTTKTIETRDSRYKQADMDLAGIVVKGMKNPADKPYRMIDGRHRLLKAQNSGRSYVRVYVIEEYDALKFIS